MRRAFPYAVLGWLALVVTQFSLFAQQPKTSAPVSGDPLLQMSERFEAIVRDVLPAVVSIDAVKQGKSDRTGKSKPVEETGSGAIVKFAGRSQYFVITNNHVIAQAAQENITIYLSDGRILRPSRVWADPETDVAFMSVDGALNLPTARLGNSDQVRVGQVVLAMGNPFGLSQTVTHGIISARDRGQVALGNQIRIKDFLQTDAAINPGSSGGPLVNLNGEVIGFNTAIASPSGSNTGVAFSIPVNMVKHIMTQLLDKGTIQRGYLGAQLVQVFEPQEALRLGLDRVQGALVERIFPGTPAFSAGLRPQDVILSIDNVPVKNENHFINVVSDLTPGRRIRLDVWRAPNRVTLDAVVGDWNKANERFRTDQK